MKNQFNFWSGWVLKTLYDAHPKAIDLEFSKDTAINYWPTVQKDEYFDGLRCFLIENNFIVLREEQGLDKCVWDQVALTERGYRTIDNLPSALAEKESPVAIGAKVFGPLVPLVGGLIKDGSGG